MSIARPAAGRIIRRSRPVGLVVARSAARAILAVGVLLVGFVFHQFAVTSFFANRAQGGLEAELALRSELVEVVPYRPEALPAAPLSVPETLPYPAAGDLPDPVELLPSGLVPDAPEPVIITEAAPFTGDAIGHISIPKAGVDWTFVEGVDRGSLKSGAGHMPDTALPGQVGNAVISGHRTTYGAPFMHLDRVVAGDLIEVTTATGTHVYQVVDTQIVSPRDTWVTEQWDGAWLTLTTCNPLFSSSERLVVFGRLVAGPNAGVILDGS